MDLISRPSKRIRVSLHSLIFPHSHRSEITSDHIKQIRRSFRASGVVQSLNAIPAKLPIEGLTQAAIESNEIITLNINCLHGRARIEAAKNYLVGDNAWWYVDLYSTLTEEEEAYLIQGSIQRENLDGEIIKNVLLGNKRWEAHLDDNKNGRSHKITLLGRMKKEVNADLWHALQRLTPFDGLWEEPFSFGAFSNTALTPLQEPLVKYLKAIYDFWSELPVGSTDRNTISLLSLMCPRVSTDCDRIYSLFQAGSIFTNLIDPHLRRTALDIVLNTDYAMIPTLGSLHKNLA